VLEKPELNKVLQNRRETQRRKEWQEQASSKRTSLEMKLEQRATRLKVKFNIFLLCLNGIIVYFYDRKCLNLTCDE
jgi:hypothetical protein